MKELIIGIIIVAVFIAVLVYLLLLASKQVSDSANNFLKADDESDTEDEDEII